MRLAAEVGGVITKNEVKWRLMENLKPFFKLDNGVLRPVQGETLENFSRDLLPSVMNVFCACHDCRRSSKLC